MVRNGRGRWWTAAMLAVMAGATLGGCDLAGGPAANHADAGPDYEQSSKIRRYVAYAAAADLERAKGEWQEREVAKATRDSSLFINAGSIEAAAADLKRVRAMAGSVGAIDAAADRLIPALDRLLARAQGLDSYFRMRGYLADDLARVKREDPLLVADFDAAIAAYRPFAAAVTKARDDADAALLPRLKAEGRMAAWYDVRIGQEANALAAAIDSVAAAADPARTARADAIVGRIEPMIAQGRAARAAEAKKAGEDVLDNGILGSAEAMIGAYRALRQGGDEDEYRDLRDSARQITISNAG